MTPNEAYVLDFEQSPGVVVARATANRLGVVRFDFTIPTNARTGAAVLTALPNTVGNRSASAAIGIVGGSSGSGGNALPKSGSSTTLLSALGGVLLLLAGLSLQRFEWMRKAAPAVSAPWKRLERGPF